MIERIKDAIAKDDLNSAMKLILDRQLFNLFDILDLCFKLGKKGANNRTLVIDVLKVQPKLIDQVIEHFSTDKDFEFAFDVVQAFKLQLQKYPTLALIKGSRHPIVDMSFTDPAVDSKHVPLHVMEDLIRSDQRLLQKLFNALIVNKFPQKAAGLYLRNNFS